VWGSKPYRAMKRIIGMKVGTFIEIVSALFILLFLYTAISKSFKVGSTAGALKKTPLLSDVAYPVAWAVVVVEYIVAFLLFWPRTRKIGLYASLGLMSIFTIYIGLMMVFAPKLPCSCGGVISKMTWGYHLVFNTFFAFLALIAIWLDRKKSNDEKEKLPPVVFT
jgi:predicted anti-sigma-YlaC factor YlaD